MRTDHDNELETELRAALRELADDADHRSVADVLTEPSARPRLRMPIFVLAAAIALVVAAVTIPLIIRTQHAEPARSPVPPGERVPGNWSMISTVTPPKGWIVTQREVYQVNEQTILRPSGDLKNQQSCGVIFEAVATVPVAAKGVPLTLAGRAGHYDDGGESDSPTFAWTYDTNAWASIYCQGMKDPKSMIASVLPGVARGFTEVRIPFRLAVLPADYRIEVIWDGTAADVDDRGIDLGGTQQGASYPTGPIITVRWLDYDPAAMTTQSGGSPQRLDVDGRAWLYNPSEQYSGQTMACLARRPTICVTNQEGGGTAHEIRDRILQIVSDIEPARDLSDRSTWPSARDALPQ